jgi:hypothetical protein
MNYLLYLADKERTCLDLHHPSGSLLDRIETRLRWASALKRRIISAHLADALKTLEIHLEQSLNACTASMIRALHQLAISIAIRSVDEFDPTQRQRFKTAFLYSLRRTLAAGPNIGGDRSISARSSASSAVSARPKWTRGSMTLDDFAHRMFEWDRRLQLTPAELERSQSDTLDPQARQILAMRFGLDGCVPQTCDAIGSSLGIGPEHVAAAEYRNRRLLREDRLADRDGF